MIHEDFLSPRRWRSRAINANAHVPIDACITNPPYRRARNADPEARTIRLAGAATSANLYSAFCEIGWRSLRASGQITAITPRSFQNGTTFAEFRRRLDADVDIDCIHIWQNRRTLYGVQNVIQETVCWHGTVTKREPKCALVVITHGNHERRTSWKWKTPGDRKWIGTRDHNRGPRLITNNDSTEEALNNWGAGTRLSRATASASKPGGTSTTDTVGPPTERSGPGRAPYFSGQHISPNKIRWPLAESENYYDLKADPRPLKLHNADAYVLVNRFAPNELEPRAQACAVSRETTNDDAFVGSDRVNIISMPDPARSEEQQRPEAADRERGATARDARARGLATWINSGVGNTLIGSALGSTQINASDPRAIPVPPARVLEEIGRSPRHDPNGVTGILRSMMTDEAHEAATRTEQSPTNPRATDARDPNADRATGRNNRADVDGPDHGNRTGDAVQRDQRVRREDGPRDIRPAPERRRA